MAEEIADQIVVQLELLLQGVEMPSFAGVTQIPLDIEESKIVDCRHLPRVVAGGLGAQDQAAGVAKPPEWQPNRNRTQNYTKYH